MSSDRLATVYRPHFEFCNFGFTPACDKGDGSPGIVHSAPGLLSGRLIMFCHYIGCLLTLSSVLFRIKIHNPFVRLVKDGKSPGKNSLAFSSDHIKNITSAELVDGMYRICFEVTEGKSTTDFDCSVVIDPATSLIQSYTRSYYMPDNKNRLIVSSVVIEYGLDRNPDYSSMLSAIKK